jgi:glucose/arabinose dehydrogenase
LIAVALVAVVLVLAGGLYVWYGSSRPGGNVYRPNPPVRLEPVQAGLAWPIALGFASDGRVFFAERNTGNIRIIQGGAVLPTPFYTLPSTATAGERGLLGLALDPAFPSSPYVYAYQTYNDAANGTVYNRIVRIVATGNVGTSHSVILRMPRLSGATNHNGGVIAFGPDGKLWAVVGENADPALAQDPQSLLGKVLRLNADGNAPSDNPFFRNASWDNRVYTYGHRNMFGMDWHPLTKTAYITENGPACNDEVNRLSAGRNFGWGPSETCGTPPLPPANTNQDGPSPVVPVAYWTPTIAPTNAAFFTGSLLPQSHDDLIFGAFNDYRLRDLRLSSDGTAVVNETTLLTAPSGILDVEMGRDGFLWVTTSSTIYRLVDATVPGAASPLSMIAASGAVAVSTVTKPLLQASTARE